MVQTISGVKQNLWRKRQSGLYAPARRNFSIAGLVLYLPLWEPSQASLLNGTGIATEAPLALVGPAAQTFNVTQAGTFKIYLQAGQTGTATAGTMAVTGSPVALVGGLNTITTTGATGNFTVAVPTIISKDLNHHIATVYGATWGIQGRTFDGTDDYLTVTSSLFTGTPDVSQKTVGYWAYTPNSTNYGNFMALRSTSVANWQFYRAQNAYDLFIHHTTLNQDTGYNFVQNTWTCVFATIDGVQNQWRVFINGNWFYTKTGSNFGADTGDGVLNFGRDKTTSATFCNGSIGAAWIYNSILTDAQIQQIYLATKWRYQ